MYAYGCIIIAIATFAVSTVLTAIMVPLFRKKQFGQYIRDEGPAEHKKKEGTPTMGGISMVIAISVGIAIGAYMTGSLSMGGNTRPEGPGDSFHGDYLAMILTMLAFGLIGFIDDYTKIAKKTNLGLTAGQKMMLQILFSIGLAVYMLKSGAGSEVLIPFTNRYVNFGIAYIPFVIFVEVAMVNGVNLTDGLDGLASGITAIVALCFAFVGSHIDEPVLMLGGVTVAAACLGFLLFNKNPAAIFMGDTGSMALGGVLSAMAVLSRSEFLLPIAGMIYVIEALSVIIQVTYFKRTGGKRIFRMAPIHHHFELGGMNEWSVAISFWIFTAVCSVIAYAGCIMVGK